MRILKEIILHPILFLRTFFMIHDIYANDETSTCKLSKRFWDVHDYYKSKGGDGHPNHLYVYTCPVCKKEFKI